MPIKFQVANDNCHFCENVYSYILCFLYRDDSEIELFTYIKTEIVYYIDNTLYMTESIDLILIFKVYNTLWVKLFGGLEKKNTILPL